MPFGVYGVLAIAAQDSILFARNCTFLSAGCTGCVTYVALVCCQLLLFMRQGLDLNSSGSEFYDPFIATG